MNLAEFPIAALTDRVPDGQTTLVFEDRLDQRDGPPIVRRLTIMAPSKHGLPAAVDDEVIVGLIQLTKRRNNFTDPKVQFSRYELIDLLGWPQTGPSYRRIEEALHRWVGVVLVYENAWWDNQAKSWVDESFHILENVSLYDRERRKKLAAGKKPAKKGKKTGDRGRSPALVRVPLERGDLPELPERQPQAARPRLLLAAPIADDQADVPVPRQAILPPRAARFRPQNARLRAYRHEPILRADRAEAAPQAGARRAGGARLPGAAVARGALFLGLEGVLADPADPRRPRPPWRPRTRRPTRPPS